MIATDGGPPAVRPPGARTTKTALWLSTGRFFLWGRQERKRAGWETLTL